MKPKFGNLDAEGFIPLITALIVVVIVILGLYAMIYSPRSFDTMIDGNFRCGKIAIAADGSSINSQVSDQLARANYFLIVEPFSGKYKAVPNPYKDLNAAAGIRVAQLLSAETEEAVIAKNVGPNVYDLLNRMGIKVFTVDAGTAKEIAEKYKNAKLVEAEGPTVPQFYGKDATALAGGRGGRGYYYACPGCFTQIPCPVNSRGLINCPSCGLGMNRVFDGLIEMSPLNGAASYFNLAGGAGNRLGLGGGLGLGPGGNIVCPDCGFVMPQQRGVPCYTINCPKCGSTMTRQVLGNLQTPMNMVANAQSTVSGNTAPPITTDAQMFHEYRGVCIKCHTVVYGSTGANTQNAVNSNAPPIPINAQMFHEYRGVCVSCHTIIYGAAGATN